MRGKHAVPSDARGGFPELEAATALCCSIQNGIMGHESDSSLVSCVMFVAVQPIGEQIGSKRTRRFKQRQVRETATQTRQIFNPAYVCVGCR